ncbi:MAG: DNA-directed RNA polymerase subunit omega [Bacteroidales bacterium]|nr:DNA-directed RNA polymerase subunit omega [Bacteroidales bacterium]MCF8332818.1 DNA-directed RNA polymerase subunit omega [Bacteroidales bacterium]
MDYKKIKAPAEAVTRDVEAFSKGTNNIYETTVVLSKRANQIGLDIKEELNQKIEDFATPSDNLEEVFENREQIEIARFYEKLPKPTLLAIQEYLEGKIYFRNPAREDNNK